VGGGLGGAEVYNNRDDKNNNNNNEKTIDINFNEIEKRLPN